MERLGYYTNNYSIYIKTVLQQSDDWYLYNKDQRLVGNWIQSGRLEGIGVIVSLALMIVSPRKYLDNGSPAVSALLLRAARYTSFDTD